MLVDKAITLPTSSVSLSGSATDADNDPMTYSWTKYSGGAASIASPSSLSTNISGLVQGTYTFRLTANDGKGGVSFDDVIVTVKAATATNTAPVANAGSDMSITLPTNSVNLAGSGSDADGDPLTYAWTKISGGSATIFSPASASTNITSLLQGSYTFRLTVNDGRGGSSYDDVSVVVNAAGTVVQGTVRTLVPTDPTNNDFWCPNGCSQTQSWKPGDIIEIPAGHWGLIDFGNVSGTAANPIIIRNKGGLVSVDRVRIQPKTNYIKFLGNGVSPLKYGFKIGGVASSTLPGTALNNRASYSELAYLEINHADIGIMMRTVPDSTDPESVAPFVQKDVTIHDNLLHDIHGEGMYLGPSSGAADDYNMFLFPAKLDNIRIYNNIVKDVDWDGIQLANCLNNADIHHNTVTNFGIINKGSQQAGIIMGAQCNGAIHDNDVSYGTGNGIQAMGYGVIQVYNNIVKETGLDGTSCGQEAMLIKDDLIVGVTLPKQQAVVTNNTIDNVILDFSFACDGRLGTIRVANYVNNSLPATIQNNSMGLRNVTSSSNWLTRYIKMPLPTSTVSGNQLIAY